MTGLTIPVCRKKVVDKTGKFLYEAIISRVHAQEGNAAYFDVTVNHATVKDEKILLKIADNEKDWFMEHIKKFTDKQRRELLMGNVDETA